MQPQKKVAVAVNRSQKSRAALIWALKNLLTKGESITLLHVYQPIRYIPFPAGKFHVHHLTKEVVNKYRAKKNAKIDNYLKVFSEGCLKHGVNAIIVKVEDSSVEKALVQQIFNLKITELVLGKSYKGNFLTRNFYGPGISDNVFKNAPKFCAVSIISKEQQISRSASQRSNLSSCSSQGMDIESNHDQPYTATKIHDGQHGQGKLSKMQYTRPSISSQSNSCLLSPKSYNYLVDSESPINIPMYGHLQAANKSRHVAQFCNHGTDYGHLQAANKSRHVAQFSNHGTDQWPRTSSARSDSLSLCMHFSDQEIYYEDRLTRQSREPKPYMEHTENAKRKMLLNRWKKMEQVWEQQVAKEVLIEFEHNGSEEQLNGVFQDQATLDSNKKETTFDQDFKDNKLFVTDHINLQQRIFREYTIDEIRSGTHYFSQEMKIGEGRHGTVYKGRLDFKNAAIKVLKDKGLKNSKELFHKVEIIGNLRHQNVVSLLGYCYHEGVYLAYEHMANGSLDDHLFRKGRDSCLPWHTRFQIAAQVATALDYLHNIQPETIIHFDIKPSNILLDYNNMSKLGDVGIARLVAEHNAEFNKNTFPVSTFSYFDPEYQKSGTFDKKSDIYALGIVLLQLLTGRSPLGLHDYVETAIDCGSFCDVLDPKAGEWPLGKAKEVACIALQCAETRRKHRPDLQHILHVLNKIRSFAEEFASADTPQTCSKQRLPTSYHTAPRLSTRKY